jgi:uroporphyrin-III C-methyltransferase
MGKIYLIGAGPGDPELLTLKAVRAIRESDVILYDHLINPECLRHCKEDAEIIFVGKSMGDHTLPQEEINALIVSLSEKYNVVSRLKGGDPLIFGRGGEEYEFILNHGLECEIIPGITTAMGAGAALGLPLTHRNYSSEVRLITGHKKKNGLYSDFTALDLNNKTYVVYMALTALQDITDELLKNPENDHVPVAVVEKATRINQRLITGTLKTINQIVKEKNVQPPAILIIGQVVKFVEEMQLLKAKVASDTANKIHSSF